MESVVVNARVPAAKRDFARPILESIGSTTTDLINSAYDYLIVEGELPSARKRAIADDRAKLDEFLAQTTCAVDWGEDAEKSYKELIAEGKARDYESLA